MSAYSARTSSLHVLARRFTAVLAVTVASILFSFLLFQHQKAELSDRGLIVSDISGHYQFIHPDAWYHLRLARDLKTGAYGTTDPLRGTPLPHPPPAPARLANLLSGPSVSSLERTAFYLSPVLAWFMFPALLLWGLTSGRNRSAPISPAASAALISWMVVAASPYWIMGTSPGTFDTHAINALFPLLTAFFLYRTTRSNNKARPFLLLGAAICTAAAGIWWKPGLFFCAGLFVLYGLTCVLKSTQLERAFKLLILALAAGVAVLAFGPAAGLSLQGYDRLLPPELHQNLSYLADHLRLLAGLASDSALIGEAVIDELTPTPFGEMAVGLCGSVTGFIICCCGILLLFIRRPMAGFFLLPFAAAGVYSFFSFRFFIFFLPLLGLGLGTLACGLVVLMRDHFKRPAAGWTAALILAAAVLGPGLYSAFNRPMNSSVLPPYMHELAVQAAEKTPPDATLWTWWSEGYFFQYVANRKTFFDGGRQTPLNTFIAGYALTCRKPELSAAWITFFTRRGPDALYRLASKKHDPAPAVDFLLSALNEPAGIESAAEKYGITLPPDPKAYLFPEAEAYVCLPYNTINSFFWYRAGIWRDRPDPNAVIRTLSKSRTPGDTARKALLVDGRPLLYGAVIHAGETFQPEEDFNRRLLIVGKEDTLHLVDPPIFNTVAYRLLGPAKFDHPGFSTIYKDRNIGGIWKVE